MYRGVRSIVALAAITFSLVAGCAGPGAPALEAPFPTAVQGTESVSYQAPYRDPTHLRVLGMARGGPFPTPVIAVEATGGSVWDGPRTFYVDTHRKQVTGVSWHGPDDIEILAPGPPDPGELKLEMLLGGLLFSGNGVWLGGHHFAATSSGNTARLTVELHLYRYDPTNETPPTNETLTIPVELEMGPESVFPRRVSWHGEVLYERIGMDRGGPLGQVDVPFVAFPPLAGQPVPRAGPVPGEKPGSGFALPLREAHARLLQEEAMREFVDAHPAYWLCDAKLGNSSTPLRESHGWTLEYCDPSGDSIRGAVTRVDEPLGAPQTHASISDATPGRPKPRLLPDANVDLAALYGFEPRFSLFMLDYKSVRYAKACHVECTIEIDGDFVLGNESLQLRYNLKTGQPRLQYVWPVPGPLLPLPTGQADEAAHAR